VDIEADFMDYTDVMEILETVITNAFENVERNCLEEQKCLVWK